MRNILFNISYDGSAYHGWQVQNNAISVQEVFQQAMLQVVGCVPDVKACSRTDTGVHARQFCISAKIERNIPCEWLTPAMNHFLPPDVAVLSCREVPMDFHARYSCRGKEYVYQIWNAPVRDPFLYGYALHYWYPMDLEKLNRAAAHYLGTHDFTSFCTIDARDAGNMVRTVTKAEVSREGDMVRFTVAANGFLYHMVRIMAGTLLRVAQGKFEPEQIPQILEQRNRHIAGPTAPPGGLYLNRVFYDEEVMG